MHRSGFIAIIGEANSGKSTLLNGILGRKISIVSPKANTTRNRILGVKRLKNAELVFADTPGFSVHSASGERPRERTTELSRQLGRTLQEAAAEVDVRMLVVDAARFTKKEPTPELIERVGNALLLSLKERHLTLPDIIVLNKVDLIRKDYLLPLMAGMHKIFSEAAGTRPFEIVPISALHQDGVAELLDLIVSRLPEGDPLFPADIDTDQSEQFFAAEIIREKLFLNLYQELPQGSAVLIERWDDNDKRLHIEALITVERDSQKPIVLGKGGQMIKKIGETARLELESRFEGNVVLKLHVRVEENWSRTQRGLERAGYKTEY